MTGPKMMITNLVGMLTSSSSFAVKRTDSSPLAQVAERHSKVVP